MANNIGHSPKRAAGQGSAARQRTFMSEPFPGQTDLLLSHAGPWTLNVQRAPA
ncbi:hypothetical protein [Xylella fastidiosa]|uniref:hypothetical protein n=1 Tax=Xylella fastidiosa TaxID=2371 RepID=UPI0013E408F0|nr:hypothetical protein [Xylella fastidiosa]WNY19917.1 hypothetical protein RO839_04715 [Xylella fastidiosa]WNY22211.1 hypothetical protein RO838_04725 [Xylella fastidiosa]